MTKIRLSILIVAVGALIFSCTDSQLVGENLTSSENRLALPGDGQAQTGGSSDNGGSGSGGDGGGDGGGQNLPGLITNVPPAKPGFPNLPQIPGELLAGPVHTGGRQAVHAFFEGVLFTSPERVGCQVTDGQVRSWDISDPRNPVVLDFWGQSSHGFGAHAWGQLVGQVVPLLVLATFGNHTYRPIGSGTGLFEKISYPEVHPGNGPEALYPPWNSTTYSSYGTPSGNALLKKGTTTLASWDHLGLTGVIGTPIIIGNLLLYGSDQSNSGVAAYDISDPTNPVLLDVLKEGVGGYVGPAVWEHYLVFPSRNLPLIGIQVVDFEDPTNLKKVAELDVGALTNNKANPMYVQFQDNFGFFERFKVNLERVEDGIIDIDLWLDEDGHNLDASQLSLPLGNLLITGGCGPNMDMGIWAHQEEPDFKCPSVGYHIPKAGQTNYPVGASLGIVINETLRGSTIINGDTFELKPVDGGNAVEGTLFFSSNDVLTFNPEQPLLPNTQYKVKLRTDGIRDAAGNGLCGKEWMFTTGS